MHYATTDDQNTIIVVWVPVLHFIYLWKKKKKHQHHEVIPSMKQAIKNLRK